jgi:methylthioribulose 1-phosphate dehydratase/enolase-phosphatase E1
VGLDWSTPNHGPILSARRGLSIAGESSLSTKARKDNGDIDPSPVSSHNPPFLFKAFHQ